jgi:tetratricopeptide (TPR) repeat protein
VVLLLGLTAPFVAAGSSRPRAEILHEIQQLLQQDNLTQAENQVAEALKEFPRDAAFYDLLGVVEAKKGNHQSAESAFLKAIDLDPLLTGAYLNLGHLYQEKGAVDRDAPQKALATYGKLLRFDPGNVEANYQSALLLERRRAFRESLNHLSRLQAKDQETAQALSVRCADLAGLGVRNEANVAVDRLLNSPDLSEPDVLLVLPVLEDVRWSDLEERLLEGAVRRQVAGFDLFLALGRLYPRQNQWDEARATLEKAVEARPQSAEPLIELARVADKQRDYQGALGYLAHARDLDPDNAAIHFFFGMVCVEEDLLEEAYRALQQAVSLAPDNAYYNYALGAVAQHRANPGDAVPFFKKYCALRPLDPRGRLQLGITYFQGHQDDLAEKELKDAVQHRETAAAAHFFLGRIANQKGAYPEALRELEQALAAEPNYADPYAEEGIIYLKQKAYVAAETALRRALAIDPNHYAANLNLMMLYQRTGDTRAGEQAKRFEEVKKKRAESAKLSLRSIEIVR